MSVPRFVFLFNYRTMFESSDLDRINFDAWREVLDAFGYDNLSYHQFLTTLSLEAPAQVMKALCPFTTRAEWDPVLNKRDVRLAKEVERLAHTDVRVLNGLKDFIIAASRIRPTTVVLVSPLPEQSTRGILRAASMESFVDVVHAYHEREFALLDALEVLNVRPRTIPTPIHHKWESDAASADSEAECLTVAFEADPAGVAAAKQLGLISLGITFNPVSCEPSNEDEAADGGERHSAKRDNELLCAGAATVLRDLVTMRPEYLPYLAAK